MKHTTSNYCCVNLFWVKKRYRKYLFVCLFVCFLMNVYFTDQAFVSRVTEVLVVNHSHYIKVTFTRWVNQLSTEK